MKWALSPLGERVARAGVFSSRRGSGEGVASLCFEPPGAGKQSSIPRRFENALSF